MQNESQFRRAISEPPKTPPSSTPELNPMDASNAHTISLTFDGGQSASGDSELGTPRASSEVSDEGPVDGSDFPRDDISGLEIYTQDLLQQLTRWPCAIFVQSIPIDVTSQTCQVVVVSTMSESPKEHSISIAWPKSYDGQPWNCSLAGPSRIIPLGINEISQMALVKHVMEQDLPEFPILKIPMPYPEVWEKVVDKFRGLMKASDDTKEQEKIETTVNYLQGARLNEEDISTSG